MIKLILLIFVFIPSFVLSQDLQSLEKELDNAINKGEYYHRIRLDDIDNLKQQLRTGKYLDRNESNAINYKIATQYAKFQSDSALNYIQYCKKLLTPQDDSLHTILDLDLAALYSTTGRYIEAINILKSINKTKIAKAILPKYYQTYGSFYSHYGQSNNNNEFYRLSEIYRDSLISCLDTNQLLYKIENATKKLFSGNRAQAIDELKFLLNENINDNHQVAIIAYLLGIAYKQENNAELQKYYLIKSAIADVKNANKDNASLQDLAMFYYGSGDFDRAFILIDKAIRDAIFCNVRYRIIEGTTFYPIINYSYQKKINDQNRKLTINLILISILSLILIGGIFFIVKQFNKLKAIKSQLSETNSQLIAMNQQIYNSNIQLAESNHIKEEYIAQFFDMCSSYIEKIDTMRKGMLKKANNQLINELLADLKSTKVIEEEVAELYHNFDSIFLNLYPSFINDFNKLLRSDEIIIPKKGELLNTELRIFALIRLGIDDSVKIASFLRYSLRTVYNYRTKVRNKAIGNRDEFENLVKNIGNINRK
jgi:hypothetical protein